MRYWLVMPAAGSGRRFGGELPKQYALLAGRPVMEWALAPFLDDARCRGVVVAVATGDAQWEALRRGRSGGVPLHDVPGGRERADSVLAGLRELRRQGAAEGDLVLVHDAARPCLAREDLDLLLDAMAAGAPAALLATPLADTLKQAAPEGTTVAATVPRQGLWRALTPQAAPLGPLQAALEAAAALGRPPTDESEALEAAGLAPRLVPGSPANLKITTPGDLRLAQALLAAGGRP